MSWCVTVFNNKELTRLKPGLIEVFLYSQVFASVLHVVWSGSNSGEQYFIELSLVNKPTRSVFLDVFGSRALDGMEGLLYLTR